MQDRFEAAAIDAQEAAGRAHAALMTAKVAGMSKSVIEALQADYEKAKEREDFTWSRYAQAHV